MSTEKIILYVLLFALATIIVYAWGLKKSLHQGTDLERMMLSVCGSKVVRFIKKHGSATKADIAKTIEGVKVGPAWSKNKLTVTDGAAAADAVIEFLISQQYIVKESQDLYILRR